MRLSAESSRPVLPGSAIELERPGADDGVIGHELGGFEIALDAGVLHELHVAEVREALAADRVARRVDADVDVDAGQVANRVGVLARSSAGGRSRARDRRRARSRTPSRTRGSTRPPPRARRRSAARSASSGGIVPVSSISATFSHCCQSVPTDGRATSFLDAEAGLRLGGAVALEAVLLEGGGGKDVAADARLCVGA